MPKYELSPGVEFEDMLDVQTLIVENAAEDSMLIEQPPLDLEVVEEGEVIRPEEENMFDVTQTAKWEII